MERKINKIHRDLHVKFGENLEKALADDISELDEIEIKSIAVYYFGKILLSDPNITDTRKEIAKIYNEIFTDFTIVSYLSCSGIDNGARIILRRILELGVASVYLWDSPQKYWNWSKYDDHGSDLNFKEMIEHLNNRGYIDFLNSENNSNHISLIDKQQINKIYRELSNVIHGKSMTFESAEESSFTYQKADLETLVELTLKIQNYLITMWSKRFQSAFERLKVDFSAITNYTYGN